MSDSILLTEVVVTELLETVDEATIIETMEVLELIETPAEQGPAGKDGMDGSSISEKPKNRLTREIDGLYVSDDLSPDPLAYYILAKN